MISFKLKNRRRESRRQQRKKNIRRKYIRYSIFSLICYCIFLLWTLPASVALSFLNNNPQLKKHIKISSVNGTIWNGNAGSSQLSGINVGQLKWRMSFLPLLIGELQVYITFNNNSTSSDKISGSGFVSISAGGDLSVEDFSSSVNVDALSPFMYGLPARFAGDLNIHINELTLEKGQRINITSRVVVSRAGLVSPQRIEYGTILIQATPKLTGSEITLTDQGGPLILNGTVKLKGNGVYNMNLGMGARNSASDDLRNGLRFLGQRDATGKYHYKANGKLSNW